MTEYGRSYKLTDIGKELVKKQNKQPNGYKAYGNTEDFYCTACHTIQKRKDNFYKRNGKLVCGSCKGE